MIELLKMLALIAAGGIAIKLLTRTMTPNKKETQTFTSEEDTEE